MNSGQAKSILRQTQLFGALDDTGLEKVAALTHPRVYQRGDAVFHQGDLGDVFYVIASGLVKIFLTSERGEEMLLATLGPLDSFGELALVDEGPRTASAKAMQESVLLAVGRSDFLKLLRSEPLVDEALHRFLGKLLRRVLAQASDLVFLDLPGRVAKLLISLAEAGSTSVDRGSVVHLDVSQGDLARMVGGSRPSVNQILRAFEARGYVRLEGRNIVIRDPQALRHRGAL